MNYKDFQVKKISRLNKIYKYAHHFVASHFRRLLFVLLAIMVTSSATSGSHNQNNAFQKKSFHFVWRGESLDKISDIISLLERNSYHKLYIGLTKSVCLEYEFWDCGEAIWTADELLLIIAKAKSHGLEVVLEIKLLNKIKKSFKHLPHLLYNDETLDPGIPEFSLLYDATFEYVVNDLGISEILIGYDEIFGFSNKDKLVLEQIGQKMLPNELFIDAVNTASVVGDIHGLSVGIWGDMLLRNTSLPCPGSKHNHGSSLSGYGQNLLPYIPKNIKIISWYYRNTQYFCGIDILIQNGFQVAVAVFQPNETRDRLLAHAHKNNIPEAIFTSFRFIRHKRNSPSDLCNMLELGDCSE